MSGVPFTRDFKSVSTPSGKKAFDAYSACWRSENGIEVFIGAPSLEELKAAYLQLTGSELIVDAAQHVWVVKAEK